MQTVSSFPHEDPGDERRNAKRKLAETQGRRRVAHEIGDQATWPEREARGEKDVETEGSAPERNERFAWALAGRQDDRLADGGGVEAICQGDANRHPGLNQHALPYSGRVAGSYESTREEGAWLRPKRHMMATDSRRVRTRGALRTEDAVGGQPPALSTQLSLDGQDRVVAPTVFSSRSSAEL